MGGMEMTRRQVGITALGLATSAATVGFHGPAAAASPMHEGAPEPASRYGWQWGRPVVLSARSNGAMIATSRGGRSTRGALAVLEAGGNAIDGALSHAVAQIVHSAGYWTSFAGLMTLVYYEAATGRVHSLDAGYNSVMGEKDPMTITTESYGSHSPEIGRAVLVPGFMAGLEAAHERFGALPFARIFESGISLAEDGMVVAPDFERNFSQQLFTRLPETRAIFSKSDGSPYKTGDVFRQPALAKTLRAVAAEGARYMYTGAWARKFVDGVRADGGKMTMADLANYKVEWSDPIHTDYKGYDIYSLHHAHFMHGGLRLAEEAKLADMGRYYENPDVFYWYHKIFRATGTNMSVMGARIDELPVPPTDWLDDAKIKAYWPLIRDGRFGVTPGGTNPNHTDAFVVVDAKGNVAALMHSTMDGLTGRYVDGVSYPAPATVQQQHVRKVGPGKRLPSMVPNTIVLKDGQPVFATAAGGNALHQETIKILTNLIDYNKAGREAMQAASFLEPFFTLQGSDPDEAVLAGDYPAELLDAVRAKGMQVTEVVRHGPSSTSPVLDALSGGSARDKAGEVQVAPHRQQPNTGQVLLVVIDPKTREREGVSTRHYGEAKGA